MIDAVTPSDVVKCPWCATLLEWTQNGQRWKFRAHTDEFCRDATRQRVRDLEQALAAQRETWEYAAKSHARSLDAYLRKHGLPTPTERLDQMRTIAAVSTIGALSLDDLLGMAKRTGDT